MSALHAMRKVDARDMQESENGTMQWRGRLWIGWTLLIGLLAMVADQHLATAVLAAVFTIGVAWDQWNRARHWNRQRTAIRGLRRVVALGLPCVGAGACLVIAILLPALTTRWMIVIGAVVLVSGILSEAVLLRATKADVA